MPDLMIDARKVKAEMNAIVEAITHPAFVEAMKNLKATPVARRQEYGKKNLTAAALRQKGVNLPAQMRLTTRYFEPGKPGFIEWKPDGTIGRTRTPTLPIGDGGTVQWGGCACGGGLTFCGGAGGST